MSLVASARRARVPIGRILGVRLPRPFSASVEEVRAKLTGREQALFDLLCVAGHLGRSLPNTNTNRRTVSGARDPRKRLARLASRMNEGSAREWRVTSARLVRFLARELRKHESEDAYRALRVLLGNASIAGTGLRRSARALSADRVEGRRRALCASLFVSHQAARTPQVARPARAGHAEA